MPATYELKASGKQFMWNLKAANGEPILHSERYATKSGAKRGIESARVNSALEVRYDRRDARSTPTKFYFVLKAGNGEIIGKSELYTSPSARDQGIQSCETNGPTATTTDRTSTRVVARGRVSPSMS